MRALVLEDEPLVAQHLLALIARLQPAVQVLACLETVASAVAWFQQNPSPDVVFMDIHLADGLSFGIFDRVSIACPVIFTTAYDQYAIRAFKVNSVDYLLKPIGMVELQAAWQKLHQTHIGQTQFVNQQVIPTLNTDMRSPYKERFVVRLGEHLKMIPTNQIAYFMSADKSTWLCCTDGRQYPVDLFLDALNELVEPAKFFRINRKYLINIASIADIVLFSGSRLWVKMQHFQTDDTLVSRERVADFRQWLEG